MNPNENVELIFEQALALESEAQRAEYLDRACPDEEFRREVESLLRAHKRSDTVFDDKTQTLEVPLSERAGTKIGRYKLLQQVGEGGMGVVYMAEQEEPVRRRVALKIIKVGMDTRQVVARFEAERQALAMMDHPNIAKVLDGGATETGRPYFVMELVQGVPITDFCDKAKLSATERLKLLIPVCQAVQHAHQKGIIHRDIKPSNVLVTLHDGVPTPKVIDFGVAKATNQKLTEKTLFTNFATMIGTPAYMSPEQAEMSGLDVDTRTDIYALGVLLYQLLTGTTPFPEKRLRSLGYGEMQRVILEEEPDKPSTRLSTMENAERTSVARNRCTEVTALARMFKGDLDWIVMKCLEKDRTRRYETASGLSMDISRYLGHEPILARPPSAAYRLRKAIHRNRGFFAAIAAIIAVLLVGIVISAWQAAVARREAARASLAEHATAREASLAKQERDRALSAEAKADRNASQARRNSYVANLSLAAEALRQGNLAKVRALLVAQTPSDGEEDMRDFEWRYLWRQSRNEAVSTLPLPRVPVYNALFTPDGAKLITAQLYDQVRVFDSVTLRPIAALSTNVLDIVLSRDGRTLAVLRNDLQTQIFDIPTLNERLTITNIPYWADKILISPDGQELALAEISLITLWDTASGQMKESIPIRNRPEVVGAFAAFPDWSTFLTCDQTNLFLWDRRTHALVTELPSQNGLAYSASFSPNGKWCATGGWFKHTINLWNLESRQLAAVLTNHNGWIGRMDFSPDGSTLASCGSDHSIRLWDLSDLKAPKEKAVFRGHSDEVWVVAFSPDARVLLSGDRGGEASLWNAAPPPPPPTFLEGNFMAETFSLDSQSFTTLGLEGTLQTWDAASLRELRRGPTTFEKSASARFSPDGSVLATGLTNGQIQLHNLANPTLTRAFIHGAGVPVLDLEFSASGRRLASATAEDLRVWDVATGASVYHATNVTAYFWRLTPAALSPDDKVLAFATTNLDLCIVQLDTRSERRITPDLWGILAPAFSPDGRYLVGAGRDHRIKIWQTPEYLEIAAFKSWRQAARILAFNPSSRRLAVALDEGGIKLFDFITTQEVCWLPGRPGPRAVSFSPDGNSVVVRYARGFQFWRAPSWQQIARAK